MTTITVTIWHNVAVDGQGHHTGMLEGYQPGDPMVRVFTYQTDPAGGPEEIAEEAFAICNGHPRDARGTDLAHRYYERELRSLSFPRNSSCYSRSCCVHRRVVWPRSSSRWLTKLTSSPTPSVILICLADDRVSCETGLPSGPLFTVGGGTRRTSGARWARRAWW